MSSSLHHVAVFSSKMIVNPRKKDYDPVKASLFNSFTTVSAILLLMNSVFNVMVYTTRNKNFKGTCLCNQQFECNNFKGNNFDCKISKHDWDEMIALLTCRRRALKLKQRRSKYRIQLSSSSSPDTSEAWNETFAIFCIFKYINTIIYL